MKVMVKNIFYKSIGVLLSMAILCGCAAQGGSGEMDEDAGTLTNSTEVSVVLLSEDVNEESVNKVKDAWQRLSEVVPLSDIEIAIGPSNKQVKREGVVNFTEREISADSFGEAFTDKCTDLPY